MKKIKGKKLIIILILLLIITIKLIFKYSTNNNYIKKYKNSIYEPDIAKKLLFINVQEKYIAHYNYGTALYQTENYKKAKEEFSKALKTAPNKRICYIRVNIALTEIKLLSEEDTDILINKIEEIQKILLGNNCATINQDGKNEKAQDLYNYLEQTKKELEQKEDQYENEESEEEETETNEEVIENETDKINKIKNKDKQASSGRNPSRETEYNENNYKEAIW